MEAQKIRYRNRDYAVANITYKGMNLPMVFDWEDYRPIRELEKRWKCHQNGFVSCKYQSGGSEKDVFLHELVMVRKNQEQDSEARPRRKPILHVNRIGLDNRRRNLGYKGEDQALRNTKKKKRTLKLPKNCGINPEEIPTYIWYLKPNGTHGARFMVDVGSVKWKTTASRGVSLVDKLEEAKIFLRNLKSDQPDLFEDRSMNGDYSRRGQKLAREFQEIIQKAGYDNIRVNRKHDRTAELLGESRTESSIGSRD